MVARGRNSKDDLAKRFTEALEQSEEAFIKTLMAAVKERGVARTAGEIGSTRFVLYRYIRKERQPRFDILMKMARACGVKFELVPIEP